MDTHELRQAYINGEVIFLEPSNAPTSPRLFQSLVTFANRKPGKDGSIPLPKLAGYGLFEGDGSPEYFSDIAGAHQLVRECLIDIAESGRKARESKRKIRGGDFHEFRPETAERLNEHLHRVTEQSMRTVENGKLRRWRHVVAPTLAAACAFVIASLIEEGQANQVRRCPLSECKKLFWKPIKRGPPGEYCCKTHTARGSKRIQRGKPL